MIINFKKLKRLRGKNNLTQKEMADKSGFCHPTYVDWEKGRNEPPFESIIKICKVLGINISELVIDQDVLSSVLQEAFALEVKSQEARHFFKMFSLLYKSNPEKANRAIEKASRVFIDEF